MKQKPDVIYHGKCPEEDCREDYIGETKRRIPEKIKDHKHKDTSPCFLKHSIESRLRIIIETNGTSISNSFRNNIMKRRIAEYLISKQEQSTLNRRDCSILRRRYKQNESYLRHFLIETSNECIYISVYKQSN